VGLGSNEGDRLAHLRRAVASIDTGALPGGEPGCVVAVSSVYETRAVGPDPALAGGPHLNAAIEVQVDAEVSAEAIVDALLRIEASHGRVRRAKGAARPLDLDLLLVLDPDGTVRAVHSERATVPHPRMLGRDFVLAPLSDVLQGAPVLHGETAAQRLAAVPMGERSILRRLDERLR
jgi:2-amino-4-hydroxy-6-hydroxymethyldihydropteridine diphosphokinase